MVNKTSISYIYGPVNVATVAAAYKIALSYSTFCRYITSIKRIIRVTGLVNLVLIRLGLD